MREFCVCFFDLSPRMAWIFELYYFGHLWAIYQLKESSEVISVSL